MANIYWDSLGEQRNTVVRLCPVHGDHTMTFIEYPNGEYRGQCAGDYPGPSVDITIDDIGDLDFPNYEDF